jgi:flavin reductase (DIM6/NTAB) family NADH-FMN oxidoreductase RutF
MSVDPKSFKDALGRFASGVTVVTVEEAGETLGITVSAFISVSLEPPLVLVSIDKRARAHAALAAASRFSVSLLAAGQEPISNFYAGWRQPDQVVELTRSERGAPVVPGAAAWLDCEMFQAVEAGDHTLYLGRVVGVAVHDAEPLVYFRGKYRSLVPV